MTAIRDALLQLLGQRNKQLGQINTRMPQLGVTIAVPNWNHEFLLARSIHSALRSVAALKKQDIPAEVLVNDDASRDGSVTLLRQLEALHYDQGLRIVAQHENGGPGHSRNMMLKRSRYRYILFLDADNEIAHDNVSIFVRAIQDTAAAVVYGNLIIKPHTGERVDGLHSNQSYTDRIYTINHIDNMALYDRVQLIDAGGYLPEFQPVEDWEMFNHLASNGHLVVFVPAIFGNYYENPQSLVRDIDRSHHLSLNRRMKRVYDQFGMRKQQIMQTRHLRYHPDIGYII